MRISPSSRRETASSPPGIATLTSRYTIPARWHAATTAQLDDPEARPHAEGIPDGVTVVAQELREDADPVSALLRLGAVRIEDAHAKVGNAVRRGEGDDPVGAHATVAVADEARRVGGEREREPGRIDDDVIVAERVGPYPVVGEPHHATRALSTTSAARAPRVASRTPARITSAPTSCSGAGRSPSSVTASTRAMTGTKYDDIAARLAPTRRTTQ